MSATVAATPVKPKTSLVRVCAICDEPEWRDVERAFDRRQPQASTASLLLPGSHDGDDDPVRLFFIHPECLGMRR